MKVFISDKNQPKQKEYLFKRFKSPATANKMLCRQDDGSIYRSRNGGYVAWPEMNSLIPDALAMKSS